MEKHNRRTFLKSTGIGLAAGAVTPRLFAGETSTLKAFHQHGNALFEMGLASYTTRAFTLDQTISMAQRVNLQTYQSEKFSFAFGCFRK